MAEFDDVSIESVSEFSTDDEVVDVPLVTRPLRVDMNKPDVLGQVMENLAVDEDAPVLLTTDFDLGQSLLSVLECPVCFNYMIPPITLCANGHNTCQKCRPQLTECPLCRSNFIETRNVALECIARELQYPCRNHRAGCDEKYPMSLINDHQSVCPRRNYVCPILPCEWKGRRHEIVAHVREDHDGHVWMQEKISFVYTNFQDSSHTDVIDALGEIFILNRRYNEEEELMYAVVQYVGPTENAAHYKYEFEFLCLGEPKSVLFRNVSQPDTLLVEDIFKSGNCVVLCHDVLTHLFKDSELWCSLAVSAVQ